MPRLFAALTVLALVSAGAARANDAADYKLLRLDGRTVKWGSPKLGRGAIVTWRIAFTHGAAPGRENCKRTTGFDGVLQRSSLSREDALRAATIAFDLWSKAANIRFVPTAAGSTANITLAAEAEPDGIAYTDVTPAAQSRSLRRSVVCFNPEAPWTMANTGTYRLAYVMAHEIGHAIGLDHPGPTGTLMSFEYDASRLGLAPGDIAGAIALYGPAAGLASR